MKSVAAMKALMRCGDTYLFLRQRSGGREFDDLPGGRIEVGENPFECLAREVFEETGLQVRIGPFIGLWWAPLSPGQVVCITFLCEVPDQGQVDFSRQDPSDNICGYVWVRQDEFDSLRVVPSLRVLLDGL